MLTLRIARPTHFFEIARFRLGTSDRPTRRAQRGEANFGSDRPTDRPSSGQLGLNARVGQPDRPTPSATRCRHLHQAPSLQHNSPQRRRDQKCGLRKVAFFMDLGRDHGRGAGAPAVSMPKPGLDPRSRRSATAATCACLLHLPPPCAHPPHRQLSSRCPCLSQVCGSVRAPVAPLAG